MKPIEVLHIAPSGLALYVKNEPIDYSWKRFHDEDRFSYRELRKALVQLQHGLCGYCEQTMPEDDCQVEHVIPRSSSIDGHPHDLDSTNMLAGCKGGTARSFYGPETRHPDPDRFGDYSCGQAKDNTRDELFIDPRTLPKQRSLFKVNPSGSIAADEAACQESGIPKYRVDRTIEILGLDVERLRRARKRRWQSINESYSMDFDNPEVMRQAAQAELFPDAKGNLPPFFTTNRSYFMPLSNAVLEASNSVWV